eukprot:TRINITY_DN11256_c0_g1_i1.p1 TRINITY_DN11256_c0_g1~~TRINITY_DN11256_c0_g1_i1.p1  ORF type:complete len:698 (+),score=179.72 TRINITY_DN11256_c0_g1_i1:24-2117(+)
MEEYEHLRDDSPEDLMPRKQRRGGGLSIRPQVGDAVTMVLEDGNRVWVPLKDPELVATFERPPAERLLGKHFADMMALVNAEELDRLEQKLGTGKVTTMDVDTIDNSAEPQDGLLWVDKYGPKSFRDLITDGPAARKVMEWMVQWSKAVAENKNFPEQRVLLLAGQPGIGKTTLARVAAQQNKFEVLEINASADRSPALLKQRITMSASLKSVTGQPLCVLVDELDGPCADVVADLATNTKTPLMRPVICTSNELYGADMRKIRKTALTIHLAAPPAQRLLQRLRIVCEREGLATDVDALSTLVETTACDVRSCLNTLQFVRRRTKHVTAVALRAAAVGHKDMERNLLDVVSNAIMRRKDSASHLTSLASGGDGDRVLSLFHESFLELPINGGLRTVSHLYDWLLLTDQLATTARGHQMFSLYKYQPSAALAFAAALQSSTRPRLNLPKQDWNRRNRTSQLQGIASSLHASMSPAIRSFYNVSNIVMELSSTLMFASCPQVRAVPPPLLTERERLAIAHAAHILGACGATLKQTVDAGGQPSFAFDPAFDQLVHFEGEVSVHRVLPYHLAQIIAQTIRNESLRREDSATISTAIHDAPTTAAIGVMAPTATSHGLKMTPPVTVIAAAATAASTHAPVKKAQLDFFGRPKVPTQKQLAKAAAAPTDESPSKARYLLRYRFHEGFTNAVRRPVYLRDLL